MAEIVDLKLTPNDDGFYDLSIGANGDLESISGLDSAIILSIFGERRATPAEQPVNILRRGWIGNLFHDDPNFENGSKVWLYETAKLTQDTANKIKDAVSRGLQWMITDGLATQVEVKTAISKTNGVELDVKIFRPSGSVDFRFFELWQNTPAT